MAWARGHHERIDAVRMRVARTVGVLSEDVHVRGVKLQGVLGAFLVATSSHCVSHREDHHVAFAHVPQLSY